MASSAPLSVADLEKGLSKILQRPEEFRPTKRHLYARQSLTYVFTRAYGIALYCYQAGFIAEGTAALDTVTDAVPLGLFETPKQGEFSIARDIRERAMLFTAAAEAAVGSISEGPALDVIKQEELSQRRHWTVTSLSIPGTYGTIPPRSWRTRISPLDTLRCAHALLSPTSEGTLPSTKDEEEGLEALQKFLEDASPTEARYRYRRAQALTCAIDIAARLGKLDLAFQLAKESAEHYPALHNIYETLFVSSRSFAEAWIEASLGKGPHADAIEPIRALLGLTKEGASKIPEILKRELEARLEVEQTRPFSEMPLAELIIELDSSIRRKGDKGGLGLTAHGVSELALQEAETRLAVKLPPGVKEVYRTSDGWTGSTVPLGPIRELKLETLKKSLSIGAPTPSLKTLASATFDTYVRLSSSSASHQLALIRNEDLVLGSDEPPLSPTSPKPPAAKRTRANDGSAKPVSSKPPTAKPGSYRLVLLPSKEGEAAVYFENIREWLESSITTLDHELGVERVPSKKKGTNDGEQEVVNQGGEDKDEEMEDVEEKPACWYGTECRTQNHNSEHATKYDHTGPNTRR